MEERNEKDMYESGMSNEMIEEISDEESMDGELGEGLEDEISEADEQAIGKMLMEALGEDEETEESTKSYGAVTDMERRGVAIRTMGETGNANSRERLREYTEVTITAASEEKRRSLYNNENIVLPDEELGIIRDEELRKQEYADLKKSALSINSRLLRNVVILTGQVIGSEYSETYRMSFVRVKHGHFTVKIPAHMLTSLRVDLDELDNTKRNRYLQNMADMFLGATIDYIVLDVDEEGLIATGSRLLAMKIKRIRNFFVNQKSTGKPMINEGDLVQARVCGVTSYSLYIEYGGVQERLTASDISYTRIQDLNSEFCTGQLVPVRIKSIKLEKESASGVKYVVHAHASIKEAGPDIRKEELEKYSVGAKVLGEVTLIDTVASRYYIKMLDTSLELYGHISGEFKRRPAVGQRVMARITNIQPDDCRIYGEIVRILN